MSDGKNRPEETSEEESFAELFEQSYKEKGRIEPGEKVTAQVLKITGDWVFLNTGRKGEGVLDKKEMIDTDGNLTVKEGDTISAWFLSSSNNEMRFTTKLGGAATHSGLEDAWRSGIPVEGFVEKEVKGGFEVKIAGSVRAFCPYSQIGQRRTENPDTFVGKHLSFRITEYGERGRNVILSHRAILEEEQRRQREELKETLQEGMKVRGRVTSIRDFGAFVSIGSIEGLLPVSEVAWGRVADIREYLSEGQEIEVVVKQLDWDNNKFSFSSRETLADPWETVSRNYPEGTFQVGKVARLTAFGAFVTLAPGIDGLVHISRLGEGKRISHPREVLKEGDMVEVKVESVDRDNRRLSLTLAGPARKEAEEEAVLESFRNRAAESAGASMGSLGDLLKAKLERQNKKRK